METGYYKNVKKIVHIDAVAGVEEQGHFETIAEYPNGGKDVKWVVDVEGIPAVPEHDEEQWVQEWVDYTPQEMAEQEIDELKAYLAQTDYVVLKIQEAIIDGDNATAAALKTEYADVLIQRKTARNRINELLGD